MSVSALRSLQRFARARAAGSRCELCSKSLSFQHAHVLDLTDQKLLCTCRACAVLFIGTSDPRYRSIPEQVRVDPTFVTRESDWKAVGMPGSLAFYFYQSSLERWVAFFPSRGGATEIELSPVAWQRLASGSALIRSMDADVEALLVRRHRDGSFECLVAPIDACYRLVASVRQLWRGQDGGDVLRREIHALLGELRQRGEAILTPGAMSARAVSKAG
jgi:uncharacterized protein DUF5947